MVVRLDLERDRLAVAEVDHAGVLARPLQHALARARAAASGAAPNACSRSAPTRAARRPRARSGWARARAARRCGRTPRRSDRARGGATVPRPSSERSSLFTSQDASSTFGACEPPPSRDAVGLALIWGASFLFIKVAVRELDAGDADHRAGSASAALTLAAARAVRRRRRGDTLRSCARTGGG